MSIMTILVVKDISEFFRAVKEKKDVYHIIIWEHGCPITEDNEFGKECWIFFVNEDMKTVFERNRPEDFGIKRDIHRDIEDTCYVFVGDIEVVNVGFKKIGYDINLKAQFR